MIDGNIEVQNQAVSHLLSLTVSKGLKMGQHETIRLSDKSGAFNLTFPIQLCPFLQPDDQVLVNLAIIKSTITSQVLRPIGPVANVETH